MFLLKKLISVFLLPTTAGLLLMAVGLGLLWWRRRERLGKGLATAGFLLLLIPSFSPVADALLAPLENRYPPLYPRAKLDQAIAAAGATPKWIVVLAGGDVPDPRVHPVDQIGDAAMSRLAEGIRLQRELTGSKLLLSGGIGGRLKHADILGAVATTMGVAAANMELHRVGRDTEEEALTIAAKVGQQPFVLVTSASHLPRATALFRRQGLAPIPAPAHHLSLDTKGISLGELFPSPSALEAAHAGIHEYIGLLWSKLRGRL
jgi:uncharacterized SAM-binding protein YcdF (DUF218 family)